MFLQINRTTVAAALGGLLVLTSGIVEAGNQTPNTQRISSPRIVQVKHSKCSCGNADCTENQAAPSDCNTCNSGSRSRSRSQWGNRVTITEE